MDVLVIFLVAAALSAMTALLAPSREPKYDPSICRYCGRLDERGDRCSRCGAWRG